MVEGPVPTNVKLLEKYNATKRGICHLDGYKRRLPANRGCDLSGTAMIAGRAFCYSSECPIPLNWPIPSEVSSALLQMRMAVAHLAVTHRALATGFHGQFATERNYHPDRTWS